MTQQPKIWFIGPVNENYSDKVQYSTIQECYAYLSNQMEIGEDIETSYKFPKNTYKNENVYEPGLDPYLSRVVMLQLGTKEHIYVIDTRTVDITPLLPLWENKDRLWIGHNLKFEAKHLLHNYNILHHKIYDTMLVEQIQTNGLQLGYSLEKFQPLRAVSHWRRVFFSLPLPILAYCMSCHTNFGIYLELFY